MKMSDKKPSANFTAQSQVEKLVDYILETEDTSYEEFCAEHGYDESDYENNQLHIFAVAKMVEKAIEQGDLSKVG
jgi:predicted aldo/keto reductase-like oxidoreductase